jgi:hypothetical protein
MTARFLIALLPLGVLLVAAAHWFFRRQNHRIKEPSFFLSKLHPHESDRIEPFILPIDSDFITDDPAFWVANGKWSGLFRKRHNGVCLVQFCQTFVDDPKVDQGEVQLMTLRSILISVFSFLALFEVPIRVAIRRLPHLCARVVSQLYWDMERRTTTLCAVAAPHLLTRLHELL